MGGYRKSGVMNAVKTSAVVGATVAACMFGALVGTTGVIMWATWDVWRKHG